MAAFEAVVAAEGRTEAQRYFQERLAALDADYGSKQRLVDENERRMQEADSRKRKTEIRTYFSQRLQAFAKELDVRINDPDKLSVQGLHMGRGSEGPRALATYYYAFLHTAAQYGSSTFCPIVIDARNQQGQDPGHLERIMTLLLSQAPSDAQVIIGAETLAQMSLSDDVIDVSWKKDQVLREDAYDATVQYIQPFLEQNLLH
jgi:hypothetical protein